MSNQPKTPQSTKPQTQPSTSAQPQPQYNVQPTPSEPPPPPKPRNLHPIIEIVGAYKHFGVSKKWSQVMRNVNLMAYSGQIYVLLGPSGSGKTTIVNVILGLYRLNQGFVKIFGFKPGEKMSGCPGTRIGYAPQSDGLFQQLTINETFRYYGKMLKLKSKYLNERISYVSDLLSLPPGKSTVHHCSDTDKRQLSFAISILHEPELLLLDEPCKGTDPVHTTSIWNHLKSLVSKGVTIFITSQSLIEANKADRMGILRSGYLLMEGNGSELISEYREKSLESLYTAIYSLQIRKNTVTDKKSLHEHPKVRLERLPTTGSEGFIYVEDPQDKEHKKPSEVLKNTIDCACLKRYLKILPSFRRTAMLLYRDTIVTFRCYGWLMALFIVPILLVVACSYTVGQTPTNLEVAVVNFEASESDCQKAFEKYISCQVLREIDKKIINLVHYKTYKEAENDAFKLKISGVVIVGEKFSNQLMRTMANIALRNMKLGNPDTAQLILRLDMTSHIVASTVEHGVKLALEKYLKKATNATKVQNATIGYPLRVGKPIFGTEDSADTEFICTGLTVVFLYHLASFLASMTMATYRASNLVARDYVAGVRLLESVISQMIVYGILIFIEAVLMYIVLILVRNLPMKGSLPFLILVMFVQIWCGLCFGFLVASLIRTNVQAGYVVFCFLCSSIILCGVLWPLDGQPRWLLMVVKFLPQTQAICAVRCIVQRGISINNEEVYMGIVIPLAWLVLFILLTYLLTK